MTDQSSAVKAEGLPTPSNWWCSWQALKGTHWSHLEVSDADLSGKNVLITGGNNGIGREAALQFARWGASIVLACRNPPPHEVHPEVVVEECKAAAKSAGLGNVQVEWWQCDMADLATVEALGKRWLETGRPLDLLINNAGMAAKPGHIIKTKDGFEIVHQVNFLSHTLLTLTVLPSLAKAREPRIICTTSCMQFLGTFDLALANSSPRPYPHAKLMFQVWLTELQRRLLETKTHRHITIQGVHPGYVNTGIWNSILGNGKNMTWTEYILNVFLTRVAINPQQGSLAIVYAATAKECGPSPSLQGVGQAGGKGGGRYFNRTWEETPMPQAQNALCRQMVWDFVGMELKLPQRDIWRHLPAELRN